ncbi:nickel pincer cofactor biosynthesis protein LarB [Myxococcota bacterium]|nr:nickel pincer cofactor biosynthesis protein LarB [Myxococcota bacterium]
MIHDRLKNLLDALMAGQVDRAQVLSTLLHDELMVEGMHQATVDTHRELRTGVPEVIFGLGKTAEQLLTIMQRLNAAGQPALATRVEPDKATWVMDQLPEVMYYPVARVLYLPTPAPVPQGRGEILVICAGTSDLPVAEEAAVVAELLGNRVRRVVDVGVAGLHRVLAHAKELRSARVIIVVAGMEGALPSVVAGLTDKPVIAVPTSVGYGASFQGVAALLGMLNSCASGVTVVNIDNGFGAAFQATRINRLP